MIEAIIARGQNVIFAAYFLIGLGTFLIARMLFKEEEARAAQENLEDLSNRQATSPLVKITRPFFSQYVVPMLRGKSFWDAQRTKYRRKLITAGLREEFTSDEFLAFKFVLILFFPLTAGFLTTLGVLELSWWMAALSGVLGWFYPDVWISTLITARQRKILNSLPFVVDLLALSTEAGLDFIQAIGKVVEKAAPSPLIEEFGQALREIKVGSSRADALKELALRVGMIEINSFMAILISADSNGASIGKILRQQSDQIRVERVLRAEKAGAQAQTKLMLPIAVIIMPAVFLLIFGPYIASYFGGGGGS